MEKAFNKALDAYVKGAGAAPRDLEALLDELEALSQEAAAQGLYLTAHFIRVAAESVRDSLSPAATGKAARPKARRPAAGKNRI